MHRCRHELEDDPYASGAENRRQNRDRISREVALYDNVRKAIKGGYGPPFGGHMGIPGHPYGLGCGGYGPGPPFGSYGGPYQAPPQWSPWAPSTYSYPPYHGEIDSDDTFTSPYYSSPPPPPYEAGPLCTSRRSRRSMYGGSYGRGLRNPYNDMLHDEYLRRLHGPMHPYAGYRY